MNLFHAQAHLEQEVAARCPGIWVQDNLVEKPKRFPCVVIDPDGSRLMAHSEGSEYTGEHEFTLWVICAFTENFSISRRGVTNIVDNLLGIPRFYAAERVEYGVDVVWDTRCVLARIAGMVA